MITRYAYGRGTWIDLEHPTEEEVRLIAQEFSIGERLEMELLSPTPTPLAASEGDTSFLVIHFPTHGISDGETHDQEIDIAVGDDFIITAHYEVVEPLHHLQKLLETQKLIAPKTTLETGVLLEIIFAHLYVAVRNHTDHVASHLTHIEHEMFNGLERTTVRAISNVSREFLHIEAALANQEGALDRFLRTLALRPSPDAAFGDRSERIRAERSQVMRLVMTYRAVATELRETNASLLEARQNEIMKALTTITVLVLPLELIAVIFGMHAPGTPFEQSPNAFVIIVTLMLAISGTMMLFFARKHWLF